MFTFVELEPFARMRERLFDDDEFTRLQRFLIAEPQAGDVIPGSDGCRKLRWALAGRGKRSGARMIYFVRPREDEIVLVTAYAKNVRDNIDARLLKRLRKAYEEGERNR